MRLVVFDGLCNVGMSLPAGAMPCMGLLTVEELLEPLRDFDIHESMSQ